jgi:hypothetical protein
MGRHRKPVSKLPLLGVSIVVVAGIGVGVAAAGGSSDNDTPCATTHSCPATHPTTLTLATNSPISTTKPPSPRPPRPGTTTAQVRLGNGAAAKTITLPRGDTIQVACRETAAHYGEVQLNVTAPSPTAQIYVAGNGTISGHPGNGVIVFGSNGVDNRYNATHNVLNTLAPGSWDFSFSASNAQATVAAQFHVTHGRTRYDVTLVGASGPSGSANTCAASVQAVPDR